MQYCMQWGGHMVQLLREMLQKQNLLLLLQHCVQCCIVCPVLYNDYLCFSLKVINQLISSEVKVEKIKSSSSSAEVLFFLNIIKFPHFFFSFFLCAPFLFFLGIECKPTTCDIGVRCDISGEPLKLLPQPSRHHSETETDTESETSELSWEQSSLDSHEEK